MRPCLGVVVLVGAVEVPGAGDRLVCGHSEGGGGVERVTRGYVGRGERGDGRRQVRGGAGDRLRRGGGESIERKGSNTQETLCLFRSK